MQEQQTSRFARQQPTRGPISIAFLFYLVTLAAILSACLRTLVGSESTTGPIIVRMVFVGISIGLAAGGLAGGLFYRGWLSITLGTIVGTLAGAIAGGLALIPLDRFVEISWIAFFGCWIIIVVILVTARLQPQL